MTDRPDERSPAQRGTARPHNPASPPVLEGEADALKQARIDMRCHPMHREQANALRVYEETIERLTTDNASLREIGRFISQTYNEEFAKRQAAEAERDAIKAERDVIAHDGEGYRRVIRDEMNARLAAEAQLSAANARAEGITGERLYDAFWKRQPRGSDAPPYAEQAEAIQTMWNNIAADARLITEGEGRHHG